MKKSTLIIILGMLVAVAAHSNDKYVEAMQKGMEQLGKANSPESFMNASNTFARIASIENNQWTPAYYAAYSSTIAAAMSQDPELLDQRLDEADSYLKMATEISEHNAEILALQGFVHMLRIGVDPQNRGPEYSQKSGVALGMAQKIDPENPRVLYLSAELSHGTSMFFGQDATEACEMNAQALQKFETYKPNSDDPFYPSWGKNQAQGFAERCK